MTLDLFHFVKDRNYEDDIYACLCARCIKVEIYLRKDDIFRKNFEKTTTFGWKYILS